jgi:hypothetical protein
MSPIDLFSIFDLFLFRALYVEIWKLNFNCILGISFVNLIHFLPGNVNGTGKS